jgi:photosynthetic reaction center H subunit
VISAKGVAVASLMSSQFEDIPELKNQNTLTLLEEDKIMAYFGAGTLMAYPRRRESFL